MSVFAVLTVKYYTVENYDGNMEVTDDMIKSEIVEQSITNLPFRYFNKKGFIELTEKDIEYFENKMDYVKDYYDHEILSAEIVCQPIEYETDKKVVFDIIMSIPPEHRMNLLSVVPPEKYIKNETKLIKNMIDVYNIDHNPVLTKMKRLYYIKNIMSFSSYAIRSLNEFDCYSNYDYDNCCSFGRNCYDKLELDYFVKNVVDEKRNFDI